MHVQLCTCTERERGAYRKALEEEGSMEEEVLALNRALAQI